MKLIHLSDLHIGKRVNEISMIEDQEYILLQILQIIDDEKADAVLICGDVYDKSVPSAEAVTLFDDFLCRLAQRKIPVLIISGNHDSPERLAFGNRLLELGGIHISPVYDGQVRSVTLTDEHGEAVFWLLPFIKPAHVKRFYPQESIESYTDACRVALEKMAIDPGKRNILLTHQFVTGSVTCDSEELSVGGSDNVDAAVFDPFDYVALGHIHGPQNIGSNRIRYCGTPLKYSFSEVAHHKSVTVVNLGPKGQLELHLRPLTPRRDLRQLRGAFAQLTDKAIYQGTATHDYLHIILTDEEDVPEAVGQLRVIYPNLMKLSYDNTRTRTNQVVDGAEDVQRKSPLELFDELYQLQNNQPMSDQQRVFALELIESIWEDQV
jgi:exonuclease SbcD